MGGVASSRVGAPLGPPLQSPTRPTPLPRRDWAFHARNRLAYGPRPGEVPRVAAEGVMRWIDRQLSVDGIDDHGLAERERQFPGLEYGRRHPPALYSAAPRQRRGAPARRPPPSARRAGRPGPPP